VTPGDEVGCKRLMLTDEWYPTLTKPNVELVADRIAEVTATGVRTEDGVERRAEVLVLATGFKSHGIAALDELGRTDARAIEIRPEAAEAFDRELRAALAGTVWHSGCTNWYVDENGNDPNQWPWLWSTYRRRTARIEPGTYELSTS
jgi:cation diffusion facilitator CzcD-associated flavoprotein CzcO